MMLSKLQAKRRIAAIRRRNQSQISPTLTMGHFGFARFTNRYTKHRCFPHYLHVRSGFYHRSGRYFTVAQILTITRMDTRRNSLRYGLPPFLRYPWRRPVNVGNIMRITTFLRIGLRASSLTTDSLRYFTNHSIFNDTPMLTRRILSHILTFNQRI